LVRTAAASTFNGGYAGSSNRRCLRFVFAFFFNFFNFNKTIEATQSLTLPHDASIPSPSDSIDFLFS
jgi:hypothetical protein